MARLILIAFAGLCLASAASAFEQEDMQLMDPSEGRLLFTSNFSMGTFSLNRRVVLAIILVIILGLIVYGPAYLDNTDSGSYDRYQNYANYQHYANANQDSSFYARHGYLDEDMASKMLQLEAAFKKYEVNDIECQTFVACEASQLDRLEQNGALVKMVNKLLADDKAMKLNNEMLAVKKAFDYGKQAYNIRKHDPCQPLRSKCYQLHKKEEN